MQRAKVRRTQATKAAPSRVADLHDAAQFDKLKRKYADRLIVLYTYTVLRAAVTLSLSPGCLVSFHAFSWTLASLQTWHAACKELKSFLNHLSTKAQYNHVVFLEADFEKGALSVSVFPANLECTLIPTATQLRCQLMQVLA